MTTLREASWCLLLPRELVEEAEDVLAVHFPQPGTSQGCAVCALLWPCPARLLAESILAQAVPPTCTHAADTDLQKLLDEGNRARALHRPDTGMAGRSAPCRYCSKAWPCRGYRLGTQATEVARYPSHMATLVEHEATRLAGAT